MNKSGAFSGTRPPSRDISVDAQLINNEEVKSLEDTITQLQKEKKKIEEKLEQADKVNTSSDSLKK